MAKRATAPDSFVDMAFPVKGIDVSNEHALQPAGTTATGTNVRAFEPGTGRGRGGARPGLSKLFTGQVWGENPIQHLNFIVDPTVDAIRAIDDQTDWAGADGINDPTTSNRRRRTPTWATRRVRRGGSGRSHTRNTPKITLTLTADDQTKEQGGTFTFQGDEFSESGLDVLDTLTSVGISSNGSPSAATVSGSPYAIVITNAVGTVFGTAYPLRRKYKIRYVPGTMTLTANLVIAASDQIKVQGQSFAFAGTEFTATGLGPPDTVDSVSLSSTASGSGGTAAGSPYTITPSAAMGTGLSNYSIVYSPGSFSVISHGYILYLDVTASGEIFNGLIVVTDNPSVTFHVTLGPSGPTVATFTVTKDNFQAADDSQPGVSGVAYSKVVLFDSSMSSLVSSVSRLIGDQSVSKFNPLTVFTEPTINVDSWSHDGPPGFGITIITTLKRYSYNSGSGTWTFFSETGDSENLIAS